MPNPSGLAVTKPISAWNKPLKTNFKELFKSLGKASVDAATGQWIALGKDAVDALAAVGLGSTDPAELAWALIYNALTRAICALVADSKGLKTSEPVDVNQLAEQLDLSLETSDAQITEDFFTHPEQLSVIKALQRPLKQWFVGLGVSEVQSAVLSNRLPAYFVLALNEEWRHNAPVYELIKTQVKTPFTDATEREKGWQFYGAWLQKQVQEPMMFEAFGLKDVYIPLRAYFTRRHVSQNNESSSGRAGQIFHKYERVVVDLATELKTWLNKADRQDAIRVVSGGPGAGKSSFAKVFAAEQAQQSEFPVLFVPLHQLPLSSDVVKAVGEFIRYVPYLKENPLEPENEGLRLLVIFDGLDELAMQGKLAKETAQSFVREIETKVSLFNRNATRLQVLITGREVVIQDAFRERYQILHTLPYFLSVKSRKESRHEPYVDTNNLLALDQRIAWWQKYGKVIQQDYPAMPSALNTDSLTEITAQPLLNYLVALSYVSGKLTISETTNLNTVYADLLDAVYERGYEDSGKHRSIASMSKDDFIRVLEEIALAAWHGNGRTTTVKEIKEHCEKSRLGGLLDDFEEGAEAGVTRLLAAFYFRQSGTRSDERTFEFTHKSFGEYLTARRIVRAISRIQKQLDRRQSDREDGWDEREALLYWANICGSTRMDIYLLQFLRDEIALSPLEEVEKWQETFSHLIGVMLRQGMPMERIEPPLRFHEAFQRAIHAEECLLAVLNACARCSEKLSRVDWPTRQSFGAWISCLQGQRINEENVVALHSLGYLDLSRLVLIGRDFQSVNFRQADLRDANLREALLCRADLSRAHLSRAHLSEADLRGANLSDADLRGAYLSRANLSEADLRRANLRGANLSEADLRDADLRGANLSEADLSDADLSEADLRGTLVTDSSFIDVVGLPESTQQKLKAKGAII